MALQNILIPFVSIFRSAGLKQAQSALGGLNRQYDNLSKTIGAAVGAMAGFSALQTAQQFITQSVESTQKFERNLLALNQVFEDAAPSLVNFTKEVQNYGLSQSQAAQASVFLGSVLKQYGFNVNEANAETQNLVVLAQDLATTFGYDVQEALLAITALFRGEYDPIEKFGVAMKQNEINAVRAARGLGDLTGAAQMQADAQIRLELLFERASDSMGAFERATNTLYGSQQLLTASLQNLQIAAGAPLQEPLAAINNIFSAIIAENGEQIVDVFEEMGTTVEMAAPAIETIGTALANFIGFLQPVIALGNVFIGILSKLVELLGNALNPVLEFINLSIDKFALGIEELSLKFRLWKKSIEDTPLEAVLNFLESAFDSGLGVGAVFDRINEAIRVTTDRYKVLLGIFPELEDGQKQASAAARKAGYAARETQRDLDNMTAANIAWGNSWTAKALHWAEENGVPLHELFKTRLMTGGKEPGTDYVGDFFRSIEDAVAKESARVRLAAMGASDGLIDAILGATGWEEVFKRVIRDGVSGLEELQSEFNKTAAGIEEISKALEEKRKKAQEAYEALLDGAEKAYNAFEQQKQAIESIQQAIRDYGASLADLGDLQVLATIEDSLGRFESNVISTFDNIRNSLSQGYINGNLLEQDYLALSRFVDDSVEKLSELGRQRDELAQRYSLAEALIGDYRSAFTSAAKLTSVLKGLKATTEEVTVKEVMTGVTNLGANFREFGITIEREYTEKIEQTINKSEALVDHFRNIAEKARTFAANLRKLREMGLDPMLFNQLVEAGVEAGGETAQALVDGGDQTISELNDIFREIDTLGSDLGEDVAATLYGSGIDMADGLLEGIRSKQSELETLAKDMAAAFNSAFQANITVAIENAVGAAAVEEIDLEGAKAALASQQQALTAINTKIANAQRYIKNINDDIKEAGATKKLAEYVTEQTKILGRIDELTSMIGRVETFSPQALPVSDFATSSGSTVNYNMTVNAGMGSDGTQIGEQIVNEIIKFERSSGQVFTRTD